MGSDTCRQIQPARRVRGRVRVPGDKSISHRLLILGALADGETEIHGLATGGDCGSTRSCLADLGVAISEHSRAGTPTVTRVAGRGRAGLLPPSRDLDAGNSGTTARLLMGVIAGRPIKAVVNGDRSLRRRPMRRVVEPLALMGALITTTDGRLPATIEGRQLRGISYAPPIASAQVKSAILLAGLRAEGATSVTEPQPTRDHTEVALRQFGAAVIQRGNSVSVEGGQALAAARARVPGDPSSAAVWAAAAAGLPGSRIEIVDVCLNPTRTAFLAVLTRMGAQVTAVRDDDGTGERSGMIEVSHRDMRPVAIAADEVPGVIDELPVLAALATHGGALTVRGAAELRVKESDRISALVSGLRALGAAVEEYPDGFAVDGSRQLSGGTADAVGDHRLVMAFSIAALGAREPSAIVGADAVGVSYPEFFDALGSLVA